MTLCISSIIVIKIATNNFVIPETLESHRAKTNFVNKLFRSDECNRFKVLLQKLVGFLKPF